MLEFLKEQEVVKDISILPLVLIPFLNMFMVRNVAVGWKRMLM